MVETIWFVYLLECRGQKIYTGVTPCLEERMKKHARGTGARFTKINPPERLLGFRPFPSKREAMQVESAIKRVSKPQKEAMASLWRQQYPLDQIAEKLPALIQNID